MSPKSEKSACEALYLKACEYLFLDRIDEALDTLDTAIIIKSSQELLLFSSFAHYQRGEYELSLEKVESECVSGEWAEGLYRKGLALKELNRLPEAIEALKKAQENGLEYLDDLLNEYEEIREQQEPRNPQETEQKPFEWNPRFDIKLFIAACVVLVFAKFVMFMNKPKLEF